ncbi:MAG: alpha-N-arabinofuranosidase, partial [Clostridia bacterium]|nr:alpha-N-arabinofuranosidase [Clostridia bacterium]
ALKLDKKIKIAFDEWNLRSWHHPKALNIVQGLTPEEYLYPRDKNDLNSTYTMADAVFTACFLSAMNRNCDIVGMANFAPIVNTRGCIYTHDGGIVLRSTYHVFDLYVNHMGDTVVDLWMEDAPKMEVKNKQGKPVTVDAVDLLATTFSEKAGMAVAAVNKHPDEAQLIRIPLEAPAHVTLYTLNGESKDSYNDVDREDVTIRTRSLGLCGECLEVVLEPHSVNIIEIG